MKLISTRNNAISVDFKDAVLNPAAANGGLFAPLSIPKWDGYAFSALNYQEFALKLIESFDFGYLDEFKEALKSYENFDDASALNLRKISDTLFINELYHGPTRAFKDMALQPFGRLLKAIAAHKKLVIMCATSGDTGPATLKAFANDENSAFGLIRVVCIYPAFGTSAFQALQMTSQKAKNVKSFAINADFDAAQKALKELLMDSDFKAKLNKSEITLSAANSVNFGRILFQIIYHYFALVKIGRECDVIVPSGNFGDALGAYYAKKMGAKIRRIKIASNANHILTDFFTKGEYDLRGRSLVKTISPAMDILVSSNIERLIFDKFGDVRTNELFTQLKNEKFFKLSTEELRALKDEFDAAFCTDDECKAYIKDFSSKTLIDPHTATCFKMIDPSFTTLITSTAQWVKFVPSMVDALFGRKCVDEKADILEIAAKFKEKIKPEILALFDEKQEKRQIYKASELKNAILSWIDETNSFVNPNFKGQK